MRTLTYQVKNQQLIPIGDHTSLVAGSQGYLKAKFVFGEDWKCCKRVVSFLNKGKEYVVLLDDSNECTIPAEVLTSSSFEVCVEGRAQNYRILSTRIKERQKVVKGDN